MSRPDTPVRPGFLRPGASERGIRDMATDDPARATWREWLGLAVLTLPLLMTAADIRVLFLALPSIAADLSPGRPQLAWITQVCGCLAGGFDLTMGRLECRPADRRRVVAH